MISFFIVSSFFYLLKQKYHHKICWWPGGWKQFNGIVLFIQYIHNPPDLCQEIFRQNNKIGARARP